PGRPRWRLSAPPIPAGGRRPRMPARREVPDLAGDPSFAASDTPARAVAYVENDGCRAGYGRQNADCSIATDPADGDSSDTARGHLVTSIDGTDQILGCIDAVNDHGARWRAVGKGHWAAGLDGAGTAEGGCRAVQVPGQPQAGFVAGRVRRDHTRLVANRSIPNQKGARHRHGHDRENGHTDHHLDQRETMLAPPHGCSFRKSTTSIEPFGPRTVRMISCSPTSGLPD